MKIPLERGKSIRNGITVEAIDMDLQLDEIIEYLIHNHIVQCINQLSTANYTLFFLISFYFINSPLSHRLQPRR